MIGREELCPAITGQYASHPSDPFINAKQRVVCVAAEGTDDLRIDELKLCKEIFFTYIPFLFLRVPVARRPAFKDIADIDIISAKAYPLDKLVKEFACLSHKGPPLDIFIFPRSFADKDQFRINISFAEDNICARCGKSAFHALTHFFLEFRKRHHVPLVEEIRIHTHIF